MSLPDSITLNDGTVNEVYSNKVRNGNVVVYYAPSPQGDLAGRPYLTVSQETTKAGIAKATVALTRPVLNTVTGKYDSFLKNSIGSTQAGNQTVSAREKELKKLSVFSGTYADELAAGDL